MKTDGKSTRSDAPCLAALFVAIAIFAIPRVATAAEWKATKVEKPETPPEIVAENRKPAPSEIPAMLTATGPEGDAIAAAWYSQATSRYRHGALGDRVEGGALQVRLATGRSLTYRLSETEVFEDIAPRIVDIDADGEAEIVTILSTLIDGSAIAVFGVSGETIVRRGSMRPLGEANRWLNIAGIDRYAGASMPEIAFVVTPHANGRLGFVRMFPGKMVIISADGSGFSNHVLGSTELRLSATADVDGDGQPELALPSQDRKSLRIMGFAAGKLGEVGKADLAAPINKAIAVSGKGKETVFTVGLEDGTVWQVKQ